MNSQTRVNNHFNLTKFYDDLNRVESSIGSTKKSTNSYTKNINKEKKENKNVFDFNYMKENVSKKNIQKVKLNLQVPFTKMTTLTHNNEANIVSFKNINIQKEKNCRNGQGNGYERENKDRL